MIAVIYVRLRHCHARHLGAGVSVGAAVCSQGFSLESAARGAQIRVSWDLDNRLSRSDLLPVGSCGRLCICFIRFSAVFRPVFLMLGDSFATAAALRWTGVSFPRMEDGQLCDGPRGFGMCAHGAAVGSGKFTSNIPHRCLRFACFLCCDIIDVLWNLDS